MTRTEWTDDDIEFAIAEVGKKVSFRLKQKGRGAFASTHEIMGVVQEEMHELAHSVEGDCPDDVADELVDIAVAAILGLATLRGGHANW